MDKECQSDKYTTKAVDEVVDKVSTDAEIEDFLGISPIGCDSSYLGED